MSAVECAISAAAEYALVRIGKAHKYNSRACSLSFRSYVIVVQSATALFRIVNIPNCRMLELIFRNKSLAVK